MSKNSITGRDGYIMSQALRVAIQSMGSLPSEYKPVSDIKDMKLLLRSLDINATEALTDQDEWFLVIPINGPYLGREQ